MNENEWKGTRLYHQHEIVHYKIDFCVSDSVNFVWRLLCMYTFIQIYTACCEERGGKVKILNRRLQEIAI